MNNQDYFVPSEVARLILGYLKEKNLHKTFNTFLRECPDLVEYWQLLRMGRTPATTILGHSLTEILNEFAKYKLIAFASGSMPLQNSVIVLQTSSTAKTLPTKEDVQACIAAEERDRLKKEKQKANDQNRIWSKTSSGGRRKRQQPEKISSSTTSNLLHHQISDKPLDTSDTRIILRSSVTPSPSTGNNQFDRQPQTYNPEGLQDADCRRTSLPLAAYNLSQLCNSNRPSSSEPKIISLEKLSRLDLSTNKKSTVNCCVTGATDVNRSINPESCNESGTRKSEEFDFLDKLLQDTHLHEKLAENINRALLNQSESAGLCKSDDLITNEDHEKDANILNSTELPHKHTLSKEIDVGQVIEMTESDPQIFQNFLKLFQHVPAIPISHLDVPVLNLTDHLSKEPHEKPATSKSVDLLESQTIGSRCSAPVERTKVDPKNEGNNSTVANCAQPNGFANSMTSPDSRNFTVISQSVPSATISNTSLESATLANFPHNSTSKTLNLRHNQPTNACENSDENQNSFLDVEVRKSESSPEPPVVDEVSTKPHTDAPSSPTIASHLLSTELDSFEVSEADKTPLAITENIPLPPASTSQPCHIFTDDNSLTVFSLIEKNAAEMIGEKYVHRSERNENNFEPKETLQCSAVIQNQPDAVIQNQPDGVVQTQPDGVVQNSNSNNHFDNTVLKDNAFSDDSGEEKCKLQNSELSAVEGDHGNAPIFIDGTDTQTTVKPFTPTLASHFDESENDTFEHGISYPDKVLVKPVCLLNRSLATVYPCLANRSASLKTPEDGNKGSEPAVELECGNGESQGQSLAWEKSGSAPYNTREDSSTYLTSQNENLGIRTFGSTPSKDNTTDVTNDDVVFTNQVKGCLWTNKNERKCDKDDKLVEKHCESDCDSIIVVDDSLTENSIFFNKGSRNSSSPGYCGVIQQDADIHFNVNNKSSLCSTQDKNSEINGAPKHVPPEEKDSYFKKTMSAEDKSSNSLFTRTFYGQCNTLSSPPYSATLHSDSNSPRKLTSCLPAYPGSSSLPASLGDRKPGHLKSPKKGRCLLRQVSPKKRLQTTKTVISVHSHHSPFIPAHCKKAPSRRITPKVVCQSTPSPLQDFPSSPMTYSLDLHQSSQPSTPSGPQKDEDCSNPSISNKTSLPISLSVKSPNVEPVSTKIAADTNGEHGSKMRFPSINESQLESLGIRLPPSPSRRKPRRIKTILLSSEVKKGWSGFVRSFSPIKPDRASPLLDDAKVVSSSSDLLSASQSEVEAFRLLSVLTSSYTKPQPRQDITSTDQARKLSKCGCASRETCEHHKGKSKQNTVQKSSCDAVMQKSSCDAIMHKSSCDAIIQKSSCDAVMQKSSFDAIIQKSLCDAVMHKSSCDVVIQKSSCDAVIQKSSCDAVIELGGANSDSSSNVHGIKEHRKSVHASSVSVAKDAKSDVPSKVNNVLPSNSTGKICEKPIEFAQAPFLNNDKKYCDNYVQSPVSSDCEKSFIPIGIMELTPKKTSECRKVLAVPTKFVSVSNSQFQPVFSNAVTEPLKTVQCDQKDLWTTGISTKSQVPTDNFLVKSGQKEFEAHHENAGLGNHVLPVHSPHHPYSKDELGSAQPPTGGDVQISATSSSVTSVSSVCHDTVPLLIQTSTGGLMSSSSSRNDQNPSTNCEKASDFKTNNLSSQSVSFSTYTDLLPEAHRSANSCHVSFTALLTAPISVTNVGLSDSISGALRVANDLDTEIDGLQSQQHTSGSPATRGPNVKRLEMIDGQEMMHQMGGSAHDDKLHQNHQSYTNDECSLLRQAMLECDIPMETFHRLGGGDGGKATLIPSSGQTPVMVDHTVTSHNPRNIKPSVTDNTHSMAGIPKVTGKRNSVEPQGRRKSRKLSNQKPHTVQKPAKILPLLSTSSPLLDKLHYLNQAFNYRNILPAPSPTVPYPCSGDATGHISVVHTEKGSIITIPPDYCDIMNNLLAEEGVHSALPKLVGKPLPMSVSSSSIEASPFTNVSVTPQSVASATHVKALHNIVSLANGIPRAKSDVSSDRSKCKNIADSNEVPSECSDRQTPLKISDINVSNSNANNHVKMVSKIADRLRNKVKKTDILESAVSKQTCAQAEATANSLVKSDHEMPSTHRRDSPCDLATANSRVKSDHELPSTHRRDSPCDLATTKENAIPQLVGKKQEICAPVEVDSGLPQETFRRNVHAEFSSDVQNTTRVTESNKSSHSQKPTSRKRKISVSELPADKNTKLSQSELPADKKRKISQSELPADKERKIDSVAKIKRPNGSDKNIFEEMQSKTPGKKLLKLPTGHDLKDMKDPGTTGKKSLLCDPKAKHGSDTVRKPTKTHNSNDKTLQEENIKVITQRHLSNRDKLQTGKCPPGKSLKLSPQKVGFSGKPDQCLEKCDKKSISKELNKNIVQVHPITKQGTGHVGSVAVRCACEGEEIVNACTDYEVCTAEKTSPSRRRVDLKTDTPLRNALMRRKKVVPPERTPVSIKCLSGNDQEFTHISHVKNRNLSVQSGSVVYKLNEDKYIGTLELTQFESFLNITSNSPFIREPSDVALVPKPHAKVCTVSKDESLKAQAQTSKDSSQTATEVQLENFNLQNNSSLGQHLNQETENAVKALELCMAEPSELVQDTCKDTTSSSAKSIEPRPHDKHSNSPQHKAIFHQDTAKVGQVISSPLKKHLPPKKWLSFEVFPNPPCASGQDLDTVPAIGNTEVPVSPTAHNYRAACMSVQHPMCSNTPASKAQVSSSAVLNVESLKKLIDRRAPTTLVQVSTCSVSDAHSSSSPCSLSGSKYSQPFEKSCDGILDVSRVMTSESGPDVTEATKPMSFSDLNKSSGKAESNSNSSTSNMDSHAPICLSQKSQIDKLLKKLHRKKKNIKS